MPTPTINVTEKIVIEFTVQAGKREVFLDRLMEWDQSQGHHDFVFGFRADDYVSRRAALIAFVDQMELVLRRHDHKTTWRDRPVEALIKLMLLELEEFKVAFEHFEVKEARKETVDLANYAMILWDRLGLLDQERNAREQSKISG